MFLSKSIQFLSKITVLAAIALAIPNHSLAIAQTNPQETVPIPASPSLSLQELQQRVDTAWGLTSAEVRELFADKLVLANYAKAECIARQISSCNRTTQTIFRGLLSGNRSYNIGLNFDYDRLTSALIQIEGLDTSNNFVDLRSRLESVYGPGTAQYTSPEGSSVARWEWRLPTTAIALSYLEGVDGSTDLLYYPTPESELERP